MRRLLCTVMAGLCLTGAARAADDSPKMFAELVRPGTKVGIKTIKTQGAQEAIELFVWSDERFALELDARKLSFEELLSKYPGLSAAVDRFAATRQTNVHSRRTMETRWSPVYSPMTVTDTGADYILFQAAAPQEDVKLAIPTSRISAIRWGIETPSFQRVPAGFLPSAEQQ